MISKRLNINQLQKQNLKPLEKLEALTTQKRTKVLFNGKDKAGDFYRRVFAGLLSYASHRIPEISDEIYRLDEAMKAGFGWELGPFEIWDAIGIKEGITNIEKANLTVPDWVISFAKKMNLFTEFLMVNPISTTFKLENSSPSQAQMM